MDCFGSGTDAYLLPSFLATQGTRLSSLYPVPQSESRYQCWSGVLEPVENILDLNTSIADPV